MTLSPINHSVDRIAKAKEKLQVTTEERKSAVQSYRKACSDAVLKSELFPKRPPLLAELEDHERALQDAVAILEMEHKELIEKDARLKLVPLIEQSIAVKGEFATIRAMSDACLIVAGRLLRRAGLPPHLLNGRFEVIVQSASFPEVRNNTLIKHSAIRAQAVGIPGGDSRITELFPVSAETRLPTHQEIDAIETLVIELIHPLKAAVAADAKG